MRFTYMDYLQPPSDKRQGFTWLKPAKTALFDWTAPWKFLNFTWFSRAETSKLSDSLCYLQYRKTQLYELFENILHGFLSEIISETSQAPIETFLQYFEEKRIIFSDIYAKTK